MTNRSQDYQEMFSKPYGKLIPIKDYIMEFLDWAEQKKDATLFHYDGIKHTEPFLNSFEWEKIVDEFVDKKEVQ